jgi:hypothetical protein
LEVEEEMGFPTVTFLHALPFSVGENTQRASHPIATLAATSPMLDVLRILPVLIPNKIIKKLLTLDPFDGSHENKHQQACGSLHWWCGSMQSTTQTTKGREAT